MKLTDPKTMTEDAAVEEKDILTEVSDYYSQKLAQHGQTAKGVDWNGAESQTLRFQQLCKVIQEPTFSITDLGCGYGALLEYLDSSYDDVSYLGVDISETMIESANARFSTREKTEFLVSSRPYQVADYCVASGIFNVKLERSEEEWASYLLSTLDVLDKSSEKGFAFNCLTSYSDEPLKRQNLYYADPCWLFDVCKRKYSRNVTLLHDYNLYEFTILVRKAI
ncbi:class I SAM-dependent methyltransferase [Pseudomonas migulae]|uniref:class I SAM-dependent methyltransferase n=1 Tax=Pseudomonas migulae TaxID=78543 RepID=UPI00372153E0